MKRASIFIISTFLLTLIVCKADTVAAKPPGETPITMGQVTCGTSSTIYINNNDTYTLLVTVCAFDNCSGFDSTLNRHFGPTTGIVSTVNILDGQSICVTFRLEKGDYITLDCQGDSGGFCSYNLVSAEKIP